MLSEGELHVQAMRLVCEALEDREKDGLEVDWRVLQQQLDQMDAILQSMDQKHRYDSSEIVDLRRERDAAYEQVSTVRDEVAAEIETLRKDRDHWKTARQEAIEAGELMQAEIESLRHQLADAQREASDEFVERQVLTAEQQQDAEIWQQQVDGAKAEAIEARRQRNEEIDRHNATHAVSVQQRDEIAYLRARLDEERSVSAGLRRKLAELAAGTTAEQQ